LELLAVVVHREEFQIRQKSIESDKRETQCFYSQSTDFLKTLPTFLEKIARMYEVKFPRKKEAYLPNV
jgi:hypothetical protein